MEPDVSRICSSGFCVSLADLSVRSDIMERTALYYYSAMEMQAGRWKGQMDVFTASFTIGVHGDWLFEVLLNKSK